MEKAREEENLSRRVNNSTVDSCLPPTYLRYKFASSKELKGIDDNDIRTPNFDEPPTVLPRRRHQKKTKKKDREATISSNHPQTHSTFVIKFYSSRSGGAISSCVKCYPAEVFFTEEETDPL